MYACNSAETAISLYTVKSCGHCFKYILLHITFCSACYHVSSLSSYPLNYPLKGNFDNSKPRICF